MKNICKLLILFILIFPSLVWARIDISADASYSKQVYGNDGINALRSRSYSSAFAYYFYNLTAIEINYIYDETVNSETINSKISGTDFTFVSSESKVISEVISVGVKQALAPMKSRLRPMISLGYAYRLYKDINSYQVRDDTSGSHVNGIEKSPLQKQNSFFAALALNFRLFGGFFLKGSVQTVFPFFRPSLASDYLRYSAGFLWSF